MYSIQGRIDSLNTFQELAVASAKKLCFPIENAKGRGVTSQ